MLRVRHAKADSNRQIGVLADFFTNSSASVVSVFCLPGNPGAGDGVDKSLRRRCDGLQTLLRTGRRGQENRSQAVAMQMREILIRLFHNHVRNQHAVNARGGSGGAETLQSKAQHRIV